MTQGQYSRFLAARVQILAKKYGDSLSHRDWADLADAMIDRDRFEAPIRNGTSQRR